MTTYTAATNVGLKRTNNEDSFLAGHDPRGSTLYAVADGMGGHNGGEIASKIAIDTPRNDYSKSELYVAFDKAHHGICDAMVGRGDLAGMGTTMVALAIKGQKAYTGHVGDSRIYFTRDGVTQQVTRDHTEWGGISNALGVYRSWYKGADTQEIDILPGDRFVLCSDGLSDYLKGKIDYLNTPRTAEELVQYALDSGGHDNVTVIVVTV